MDFFTQQMVQQTFGLRLADDQRDLKWLVGEVKQRDRMRGAIMAHALGKDEQWVQEQTSSFGRLADQYVL